MYNLNKERTRFKIKFSHKDFDGKNGYFEDIYLFIALNWYWTEGSLLSTSLMETVTQIKTIKNDNNVLLKYQLKYSYGLEKYQNRQDKKHQITWDRMFIWVRINPSSREI